MRRTIIIEKEESLSGGLTCINPAGLMFETERERERERDSLSLQQNCHIYISLISYIHLCISLQVFFNLNKNINTEKKTITCITVGDQPVIKQRKSRYHQ